LRRRYDDEMNIEGRQRKREKREAGGELPTPSRGLEHARDRRWPSPRSKGVSLIDTERKTRDAAY